MGGSKYIKELTDKIEAEAKEYIDRIDALGGTLAAFERNFIQTEIQNAAYEYQQQNERGARIIVRVNRFRQEQEEPLRAFRIDPEFERQQVQRLRDLRASPDAAVVDQRLDAPWSRPRADRII
jgi:methylmalonyl-CoA mutase N-terminal domain/subunit